MNRYLLSSLVALFSISFLSAQLCEPDQLYADSTFGVYPAGIDESACINQAYNFPLTFVIPQTVTFSGLTDSIVSINVTSVDGLPDGLALSCNPPSCMFTPDDELACATIYGIAADTNAPGEYALTLNGNIEGQLFNNIPFVTLFAALGLPPYSLTLDEENAGTCLVVSTEEPLNEQVRIETAPNPFSYGTTISITSEMVNEELTLEVYTMLGERVHSESISLGFGENVIPFDGSHLAEGIYFFNFSDGKSMLSQKMIIQR
jgi:hypothetical protein